MSCRKRCKREIFKLAQYLFRLVTGTLNTGKVDVLLPRRWLGRGGGCSCSCEQSSDKSNSRGNFLRTGLRSESGLELVPTFQQDLLTCLRR